MGEESSEPAAERLLQLLTPGFLHGLSNTLFAIQSRLKLLDAQTLSEEASVDLAAVLAACDRANEALVVYRALGEPGGSGSPTAVGPLLRALLHQVRIGLRDREIGIAVAEPTYERTTPVEVEDFVRTATAAIDSLCSALPADFRGKIEFSWIRPEDRVELRLRALSGAAGAVGERTLSFPKPPIR